METQEKYEKEELSQKLFKNSCTNIISHIYIQEMSN